MGELPRNLGINYFLVFDLDNQLELDNWAFGRRNVNVTQFPAVNATDGRGFCAKLEKCFEMAGTVGYGWARLLDVDELILFPQELDTHIADILARLREIYVCTFAWTSVCLKEPHISANSRHHACEGVF